MGMSIDAMLIYGVPYEDIPEELQDQVDEMLDYGELDFASPYYDSPREDWIVGVTVDCYGVCDDDLEWRVSMADDKVPEVLVSDYIDLRFYVSPHVT